MTEVTLAVSRLGLTRETLRGEVAVITGAGGGIGRAAALSLAWLGARVVVAEIASSGAETVRMIQGIGGEALFVQTDVSVETSVAAMAARTAEAFGPASILVNNAILCPVARLVAMPVERWDQVVAVNLRGAFLTCRALLPAMLGKKKGTIINMVSTEAMPGLSAYIATKQGLVGLSQSLAAEVGEEGVCVIAFAPGMVETPGLLSGAADLAPLLGLTREEFLAVSLHPAYPGLMPADDAGAATAYLVAALTLEYHGQTVDGYAVLERAGYLKPAALPDLPATASAPGKATADPTLAHALALARQVREFLEQTGLEFGQLPVFVRPMVRKAFKDRTGLALPDWQGMMAELIDRLQSAIVGGETEARAGLLASRNRLTGLLTRLGSYCRAAPAEMARFTKDQAFIAGVTETMRAREKTAIELAETIAAIGR